MLGMNLTMPATLRGLYQCSGGDKWPTRRSKPDVHAHEPSVRRRGSCRESTPRGAKDRVTLGWLSSWLCSLVPPLAFTQDYAHVPDWVAKSEGYQTGAMVKYQGNIFYANFWASEPGVGDPDQNGWRFYDELYDQTPHTPTAQAKIIAYIPTWRTTEGFNYANDEMYQYITHGIIAFLMFSETNLGEFDPNSVNDVHAILADVINTAHRNGTSISIALGGATDYGFLHLMTSIGDNPAHPLLDQVVQKVVHFVQANALDGVDLDLECWWGKPGEQDQGGRPKSDGPHPAGRGLTLFAQKLKQALPDKLVSATVFGTSWYGNNYDPHIVDHVDWLAVMTYDLTGSWNASPVGPHSDL